MTNTCTHYKILNKGDIIHSGDEIWHPITLDWKPIPRPAVGGECSGSYPIRRPTSADLQTKHGQIAVEPINNGEYLILSAPEGRDLVVDVMSPKQKRVFLVHSNAHDVEGG